MSLGMMLQRWLGKERALRSLAADVARRCETAIWQHAGERAAAMPLAEARGYVRARSAGIVMQQADLALLGHSDVDAASRLRVVELALDLAVIRAIDVLRTRAVHAVPRRQAA